MNEVLLTGNVAVKPKRLNKDLVVFHIVAIGRYNNNDKKNKTALIPVKVFGPLADVVLKQAEIGRQVEIKGHIESRTEPEFYNDVIVDEVRFIHKSMKKKEEEKEN